MKRLLVFGTGMALVVLLAIHASAPAASHPGALRDKLQEAINRGDLAATMALWTDDAVIDNPISCAEAPCVGKAGVQKDMERAQQGRAPFRAASFFRQSVRAGVDSVPLVGLVSFFLGLTMALLTGYQLQRFGTESLIPES